MGVKRSEYCRSFVNSPQSYLCDEFLTKYDYRLLRREVEHKHTPFEWDSSDEETIPVLHNQQQRPLNDDFSGKKVNRSTQIDEVHSKNSMDQLDSKKPDIVAKSSKLESKLPKKSYKKTPKPKPLEPSNKHKIKLEASKDSPSGIFVPFGTGDKERKAGALRTHNVRSPCDVYPGALLARKRHEFQVQRNEQRNLSLPMRELPRVSHYNKHRTNSAWDSEYKDEFVKYERDKYHRVCRTPAGEQFYIPL